MKKVLTLLLLVMAVFTAHAQRITDKLDRGLVAQKVTTGIYLNWRILGEEYYDVSYNVYRDGTKLNETPLRVSNYTDKSGTTTSKYTVAAVVRGVEQAQCAAVTPWSTSYKEIKLTHEGIKSTLIPNDACCADVDGDGELEILMKYDNESEITQSFPKNGPAINGSDTGEYSIFEVLKLDGTRLWWVNCGPNMGDFQNNEQNIVAYDWDCDGKAEAVMRLAEGSTIHFADGKTYTIGANGKNGGSWTNYRAATGGGTNWFMCSGKEFLVYCNGSTGEVYQCIDYPLARFEAGESDLKAAWGDGYGHRSSKYFFGAPYLDGHKPSIFLARGIYTRHKMAAYDVDPSTHALTLRWKWYNNTNGYWKGQGYHNYGIADVDEDGRDEIVYGSMVIDDNGKGLSTTGLGHGDAQHCSDFNPYTKGLEIYACNEDQPGNNYRDATTSKIYHRYKSGNDDGRAMMGNFSDTYPGSIGCSAREGAISSVTYGSVSGMEATGINTNFRIYWDGDLCSETFNYINGKNTEGCIAKYGSWTPIYTCTGSMTNNDTKGTPCYQGDILGDWREEVIMRTSGNNIRIYSTPTSTTYRIPTLWSDHQYRNAMVWQMCGYNQPPHISYFLGKLEGITQAPPPLTMTGREEVKNGGTVDASFNDKHVILSENNDTKITLANGAKPYILTINVPSWVQGTASIEYTSLTSTIKYKYYTCNVESGSLSGEARLIKQGDGVLNLPKTEFTHTGETNIWAGTLNFDGTLKQSPLWLNRFAELNSDGGKFQSITAKYASVIRPGGANNKGEITADSLSLGFGSRIIIDIYSEDMSADNININYLNIEKKTGIWTTAGPEYIAPVIELVGHNAADSKTITPGKYIIGKVPDKIVGNISNIVLEGLATSKKTLSIEDDKLIIDIQGMRDAASIEWTGAASTTWDLDNTENFAITSGSTTEATTFVSQDAVIFNDEATSKNVKISGSVIPSTFTVTGTSAYTIAGTGSIDGTAKFIKEGTGTVTISGNNTYTGGNTLKGGTVKVSLLSNQYSAVGNLGGMTGAGKFTMENGAILQTTADVEMGSPIKMVGTEGGVINNAKNFVMDAAFSGTTLTKKGVGTLSSSVASSLSTFVVSQGIVDASQKLANKIIAESSADLRGTAFLTTPIEVAEKAKANLTTVNRQATSLALTGSGQITVWCVTEKGSNYYATRTPIRLSLTNFEGTLIPQATYSADGRFTFDTSTGGTQYTLDIPSGIIVQNSGKTLRIGQLTGKGTLGGGCTFSNGSSVGANTWQVGNDEDFKFEGNVTSNDAFTKMGTGKMTVTKAWDCTGAVNINAGTIHLNQGSTLGKGNLTVAKGATLEGYSSTTVPLTNSVFNINGTVFAAQNSSLALGNLDFGGKNVTFSTTSRLEVNLNKAAADETKMSGSSISNINKLTMNGTIAPHLLEAYAPKEGDVLRLWKSVTTVTGTPKFELPDTHTDRDGNIYTLTWDTSDIANGVLKIASVSIESDIDALIAADEHVKVEVYDANGQYICMFYTQMSQVEDKFISNVSLQKGIYILRISGKMSKTTKKILR